MPKCVSARIILDSYPAPLSDWRLCFKVKVTSQNGPHSLVSKKCDFAHSKGSREFGILCKGSPYEEFHFNITRNVRLRHDQAVLAELAVKSGKPSSVVSQAVGFDSEGANLVDQRTLMRSYAPAIGLCKDSTIIRRHIRRTRTSYGLQHIAYPVGICTVPDKNSTSTPPNFGPTLTYQASQEK
jgi:hypothetical protein